MFIGAKKISHLIQRETEALPDLTERQKRELTDLCMKILTAESSASAGYSSQRITEAIRSDIAQIADRLKVN